MYRNKLDFLNILIIAALGIISYIPLSFYDFILKRKVRIRLKNRKLYKYSWIASSIASLLGFGGATSLAFKQYFYGDYVDDKKKLLKEIGVEGEWEGIGHCAVGYVDGEFPKPAKRKDNRVFWVD